MRMKERDGFLSRCKLQRWKIYRPSRKGLIDPGILLRSCYKFQVYNWFQDIHIDPLAFANESMSRRASEITIVLKGGTAGEVAELAFDAKSSRDKRMVNYYAEPCQ